MHAATIIDRKSGEKPRGRDEPVLGTARRMTRIRFVLLVTALASVSALPLVCAAADRASAWGDFSLGLCQTLTPLNHQSVGSGWSAVQPIAETVMGVRGIVAPPFICPNLQVSFDLVADGNAIPDQRNLGKGDVGLLYAGGLWKPDRIIRRGTYHHLRAGELVSLAVESELIPLFRRGGFLLKITLANRTDRSMAVAVRPNVQPGGPNFVPLSSWQYGLPAAGPEARQVSTGVWSNGKVQITLFEESRQLTLPAGGKGTAWLALVVSSDDLPPKRPAHLAEWEAETARAWQDRLDWALQRVPMMETDIPGLADYYRRSILSGLVCIWENPSFAVNPHVSTSGMDGGALCTYLWDAGYAPDLTALMLGEKCKPIFERMAQIDLSERYAFSLDGTGVGCSYSYSPFAFTHLVWAMARYEGPDRRLFETARRLVLEAEEKYPSRNGLLDYGVQRNLLEMRGLGYEHFVPSPNAERAWCLERLAELGELLGQAPADIQSWRAKAAEIRAAVKRELWDPKLGWFKCVYPDGRIENVYSIQIFDVLRAIPGDPEIRAGLLAHLRPGAFLADYGIESVSREDAVHFEVIDTDWSGGGAYCGDGAELAGILYEIGEPQRAWDVLQRFFWMGKHLLYYPQEMLADRPAVPAHKRANCVAGLTGAQTILYGLAGFDPRPDGSLWLNPQPPKKGRIALRGYRVHGRTVDLDFQNGECRAVCDGAEVYRGPAKKICVAQGHKSR